VLIAKSIFKTSGADCTTWYVSLSCAVGVHQGPDWQKLYHDLEKEKDAALKEAADVLGTVRNELKEQTERVYTLKAEAQTANSLADFFKNEVERYTKMLEESEAEKWKINQEACSARVRHSIV
jgi:hypothetical protein